MKKPSKNIKIECSDDSDKADCIIRDIYSTLKSICWIKSELLSCFIFNYKFDIINDSDYLVYNRAKLEKLVRFCEKLLIFKDYFKGENYKELQWAVKTMKTWLEKS